GAPRDPSPTITPGVRRDGVLMLDSTPVPVKFTSDPHCAAVYYVECGGQPIPIPRGSKNPARDEWQNEHTDRGNVGVRFPRGRLLNVGLLLGDRSGGLVDGDLDAPQAVAAARFLMPETGWISGREGKPASHYWYVVADPPAKASDAWRDPLLKKNNKLLELRSTGGQTVVPPSTHPEGEAIVWYAVE